MVEPRPPLGIVLDADLAGRPDGLLRNLLLVEQDGNAAVVLEGPGMGLSRVSPAAAAPAAALFAGTPAGAAPPGGKP